MRSRNRLRPGLVAAAALLVVCLSSACAVRSGLQRGYATQATARGGWGDVEALAAETEVVVDLEAGERRRGRLRTTEPDSVTVDAGGSAHTIRRSEVRAVHVFERRGSTAKSVLIGTAVGAAAGMALGAGVSPRIDVARRVTVPILGAAGAAAGAITGYVIGRSRSRRVMIYQAP